MNNKLRKKLIDIAKKKIKSKDVAHDFNHAMQVLRNIETIAKQEKGDLDILIPAALFHDIIVYPKFSKRTIDSQKDSADATEKILKTIKNYPQEKIEDVKICIKECSFSRGIIPTTFHSIILQDADRLESMGAISIMRTFSYAGKMKEPLYNPLDPFCKNRKPASICFGLDLFYSRLLKVKKTIKTKAAKKIAKRRTEFLKAFLKELKLELEGK